MRRMVVIAILMTLAGCGQGAETPLTHGLRALKVGDHDAITLARTEAGTEVKTAIQPGDDLCMVNMADIEKYGVVHALEKLDQPDVFRLSEEARYLYALKWAGKEMAIEPDSFLAQSPLYKRTTEGHSSETCAGARSVTAALAAGGSYREDAEEARRRMLQEWMYEMKTKYGSGYDDKMRDAAQSLSNAGYTVSSSPDFDFMERQ